VPFFVNGRLIKVSSDSTNWGWGVIVSFNKQRINPKKFLMGNPNNKDYLDILS
jgi:hypothetical protein